VQLDEFGKNVRALKIERIHDFQIRPGQFKVVLQIWIDTPSRAWSL